MSLKRKILVVEDNDFVRMQIAQFLKGEGHEVIDLPDGLQALEAIRSDGDISIAIVDVRMEPIDGFEFVRTIKGLGIKASVILVTGDQNPDLLSEAQKWGVEAVLMKPVQKDRLVKTVVRTIQGRTRNS